MALSATDLEKIKALLGREASPVELTIFDTMWSEHCSYKSTKDILKRYLPTKGSEVALGIGEDAGIIRFTHHEGKSYCVAISHESHNHPSQILPVEGAATGVGGVVRDVYCMGADVIGVLNSLHFGLDTTGAAPLVEDIAQNVVIGVSDYANPLGVPVLGGETLYHPSYNDNCLVNVAAVGIVEESQIIHSYVPEQAKTEPYDLILFGKSTDATGFGGASFSSATLDKEDETTNIGAVQVHDPFLKRVIVEAIKALQHEIYAQNVPVGFKDLGAGGISCATSEIAAASGYGVIVDLDLVNVAVSTLPPEVIACSETQERFCLAVPAWFSPTVLKIFNEDFDLGHLYPHAGAAVIGKVTTEPVYRLMHHGQCLCELPIGAITTEVREVRTPEPHPPIPAVSLGLSPTDLGALGVQLMGLPNNRSKRPTYRYFDHSVQGRTLLYPGEADAVVVAPIEGCTAGLATTIDSNLYGYADPYVSGAAAVAESVRNLVSVGARPIAITDCLNYGNPQNSHSFYDFEQGVKGIADAANALGFIPGEALPVISGNVSLYNDSKQGNAVIPSPVIVALGKIENYQFMTQMTVFDPGLALFLIGARHAEFGGTQIANLVANLSLTAPQVRFTEEARQNQLVHQLIQYRLIAACHDISAGGLWVTLSEMALGERGAEPIGIHLNLETEDPFVTLFSENGGYVIAVTDAHVETVRAHLKTSVVTWTELGQTSEIPHLQICVDDQRIVDVPLSTLSHTREG